MALLFTNSRGPVIELDLPASEPPADVVLRNTTTGKSLRLRLPEDWAGNDVTLDFAKQKIRDGSTGADLSSLLDPTTRSLWVPNPVLEGLNEIQIEATAPGKLIASDDFNQTAGAITGKTALTGGNWEGDGDVDDFTVLAGPHTIFRNPAGLDGVGQGRRIFLPPTATAIRVRADFNTATAGEGGFRKLGVFARRQNTGEKVRLGAQLQLYTPQSNPPPLANWNLQFVQNVGAAAAGTIAQRLLTQAEYAALLAGNNFTIAMEIVGNKAKAWFGEKGKLPSIASPTLEATHEWLAGVGVPVVTGKPGLEEEHPSGKAAEGWVEFDRFRAYDLATKTAYIVKATMRWEKGYF